MAEDAGLAQAVRDEIGGEPGLSEGRMFGSRAFLLHGHLVCGASDRGLMARVGRDAAWALSMPGVGPMEMRGKPMAGWVRAEPEAARDPGLRRRLVEAALAFARGLPPK